MTEDSELEPIPGMSSNWFYRPSDRTVFHQPDKSYPPMPLPGAVPQMTGTATTLDKDGCQVIEYRFSCPRTGRPRTITEDEVTRGTWAGKAGVPRPGGPARRAFAIVIRREAHHAQNSDPDGA